MTCRVVCVSGLDGAQMHEVAAGIASRLGFTLVDEAIITRAAGEAGVEPRVVADVERRQTFMNRLLDALTSSSDLTAHAFSGGVSVYSPSEVPMSDELRGLIRTAIEETSARGDVVIASHAASHALAERTDVLRVLVTASRGTRCARVGEARGMSDEDAGKAVDESDSARADYLKRFYGVGSELPTQYDIVVNTDRLAPDVAVSLVALAAGR